MRDINDILSDSIDFLNIAVESQINYIQKLNKLYRTTSIVFILCTFFTGYTFASLLNGSGTKVEVILCYLIVILAEVYILTTITLLRLEARKDVLKLRKALENGNKTLKS